MRAGGPVAVPRRLTEPQPHRIHQRNERGAADIPIAFGLDVLGECQVEARAVSPDGTAMPWALLGHAEPPLFRGVLRDVPVGRHRLEVRITGSSADVVLDVDPVFVGDLWILAGQSNMEGCGKLLRTERPQEGVSCFDLAEHWVVATDPLCWLNESTDPAHWLVPAAEREEAIAESRRNRSEGAGLGVAFGKELYDHTQVPIGLIMCARGGTTLAQWDPSRAGEGGRSLYGAMLRRVHELGGRVAGCLWYQGESDAALGTSERYQQELMSLVAALRRDVEEPDLPFVFAQISVYYGADADAEHWNAVQHAQLDAEAKLGRAALVSTVDASMSNPIHLDAESLSRVGRRMAWQVLRLVFGEAGVAKGPRPLGFSWNDERTELDLELGEVNGQLLAVDRVLGFTVEAAGVPQPFDASLSAGENHVHLRFGERVPEGASLWHAKGLNPTVNLSDERGIPLVVFGPVSV